jgi:hypothetical protein
MSVAAVILLLGGATLLQEGSPEFIATAGTYVAVQSTDTGERELTLTLREDSTAELRTTSPAEAGQPVVETGMWLLDGPSVQIAFANGGESGAATGATLERGADGLVAPAGDEGASRFAGLTFRRLEAGPPVTNPN